VSIVAWKPGNSGGAKGHRKMDVVEAEEETRRGLNARAGPPDSGSIHRCGTVLRTETRGILRFAVMLTIPRDVLATGATLATMLSLDQTSSVSPLGGKTINRRAVCGRSARTVRRGEGPKPIGPSYPYHSFPCSAWECVRLQVC
jgi:hypothetical protein